MTTNPPEDSPKEVELRFFEGFKTHLEESGSQLSLPNPKAQSGQDLKHEGRPGHRVTVRFAAHLKRLAVDLMYEDRDEFRKLEETHKQEVEEDLRRTGLQFEAPEWVANPDESESHVRIVQHVESTDDAEWPAYHAWLRQLAEVVFDWGQKELATAQAEPPTNVAGAPEPKRKAASKPQSSAGVDAPRIQITWQRSGINQKEDQKRTIRALGLRKLGQTVEHDDNRTIRGMVLKVRHLVTVQEGA